MNALKAVGALAICIAVVTFAAAMAAGSGRPIGPTPAEQTTCRTSAIIGALILTPYFGLHLAALLA